MYVKKTRKHIFGGNYFSNNIVLWKKSLNKNNSLLIGGKMQIKERKKLGKKILIKKILIPLLSFTMIFSFFSTAVWGGNGKTKIILKPSEALYGTPFTITISGLASQEKVQLKVSAEDKKGVLWESQAVFIADHSGLVDPEKQIPISGDYRKKDKFGLLWSMEPVNIENKITSFLYDTKKGLTINFVLQDSKGKTTRAKLSRYYEDPGNKLAALKLDQDGLKGTLFSPDLNKRYPGVIILAGSNGGSVDWLAKAIASHGFSVLDLPYFKYPGLPENMVNIPIEYFKKAIDWIKKQKSVKTGKIGLVGGSRGGELALLLGSMFNEFKAIVGWVPAAHLWQGEDYTKLVPTWIYKGKTLPFIGEEFSQEELKKFYSGQMTSFRKYFLNTLENLKPSLINKATIAVQNIKAPLLLVSGEDDQTWPSTEFCQMVIKRLKSFNFEYECKHIIGKNAGHLVFLPDFITETSRHFNGGTREAELHESIRSWQETIRFLHKYLDK